MTPSQIFRASILLSAGVAALSVSACNKAADLNGAAPNGAYVQDASLTTTPVDNTTALPPRGEYQHIARSAPPPIPEYDQPPIPGPGYVWTPGYWDWSDSDDDYYWEPGSWIEPPSPGLYWTPGYWRYYNGSYLFSDGYWGPDVGFYGGVDYGYGYGGDGYYGGRWQGSQFYYNSAANNFGQRQITTAYTQSVPAGGNRASYNGGPGGLRIAPTQPQIQAATARHIAPTSTQVAAVHAAQAEPQLRASLNHGAPPIAATVRPGAFHTATGITAARSAATYTPPPKPAPGSQPGLGDHVAGGAGRSHDVVTPGAAPQFNGARQGPTTTARSGFAADRATSPAADYHAAPARTEHAPMERAPVERAPMERAAPPAHFAAPVVHTAPPMHVAPAPVRTAAPVQHAAPAAAAQGDRRKPGQP
jgi:hypothetical protein